MLPRVTTIWIDTAEYGWCTTWPYSRCSIKATPKTAIGPWNIAFIVSSVWPHCYIIAMSQSDDGFWHWLCLLRCMMEEKWTEHYRPPHWPLIYIATCVLHFRTSWSWFDDYFKLMYWMETEWRNKKICKSMQTLLARGQLSFRHEHIIMMCSTHIHMYNSWDDDISVTPHTCYVIIWVRYIGTWKFLNLNFTIMPLTSNKSVRHNCQNVILTKCSAKQYLAAWSSLLSLFSLDH